MRIERELMRGAGPVAVLRLLSGGEKYGYELVVAIREQTQGVLAMGESTMYSLLYNLEEKGLIEAVWRTGETGRERRYYKLTEKGRKRLVSDTESWNALASALASLGVLRPGTAGVSS